MELDGCLSWKGREIVWGKAGSGPAVVFCHGTPWSSWLWEPFADALSAEFTVYVWDMPGYGRSSKDPAHPVDFGVQAEVFTALLRAWELDRPHVVAHDYGGAVSLRATLVHGVPYASLLMADVVAIPPSGSPFFRLVKEHPDVLSKLPPYVHESVVRTYIGSAAHRELRESDLARLTRPWLGEEGQGAFYRQIAAYDEGFLASNEALLGNLDIPVTVVWGTEDAWIPLATGERLAAAIPGADLTRVPEAGHLIQLDAPVQLATLLRSWLGRVAGR
ncbi:alpha/beta fold hydrolase [Amycolatopsis suaedae]|uniref:Alpha/beta hydrolase n=1 Tax=Amycolatopsis suaedae TaxID=2510978 RepID=A0A4Q7J141_9PSEU|nr:alpha/beta hydrolase [Amycolatopsis suaedae]RZQ60136.1 alpha/beta hydrolase [Amycolatopsis suaedae]